MSVFDGNDYERDFFRPTANINLDSTIVVGFSLHWYVNRPSQKAPPMEHDLTRGNVLKTIAVFALPYMLSYFL